MDARKELNQLDIRLKIGLISESEYREQREKILDSAGRDSETILEDELETTEPIPTQANCLPDVLDETGKLQEIFSERKSLGKGDVVNKKYKILEVLGEGGMGVVYKAEHLLLSGKKLFALKVLHPSFSQNITSRKRFTREVEMAMEFSHEHAVQIREFGETENGRQFLTMDFSPGVSLEEILKEKKSLPEERALTITRQVLRAVKSAHGKGIVHRDLKPENILVENRRDADHALVLDFGIAKDLEEDGQNLTAGQVIGTPHYMSPEQAGAKKLDERTDIYSTGVILYQMVAGQLPFSGKNTMEILLARISRTPLPPREIKPGISTEVEKIICKAMERERENRFASAEEFIEAIDRALSPGPFAKPAKNKSRALAASFVAALLLVGIATVAPRDFLPFFEKNENTPGRGISEPLQKNTAKNAEVAATRPADRSKTDTRPADRSKTDTGNADRLTADTENADDQSATAVVSAMVANNFFSVESYRGQIVEQGIQPHGVRQVSDVFYRKLWKMRAEVVEPASMKGSLYIYDGSVVTIWFPQELFGLRIRGATPPTEGQVTDMLDEDGRWYMENYAFAYLGEKHVAKRPSLHWKVYPTREKPYLFPYESSMDKRYTIPLEVAIRDKTGHPWYSMRFREIAFNVDVPESAFKFEFPQNAVVFEWDLSDPGQSLDDIQKVMNFDILLPAKLPRGHEVRKIIRGKHSLPMIAVQMNDGARRLLLTEARAIPLPFKSGIKIEIGETEGLLHLFGAFAMVSWSKENTALSLIGNIPYPELISIAASVERPKK